MPSRRDAEERSHRRAGYRPARAGQVNRRLYKGETTVDGIADAFGLDDAARESARQIKTWPQMKEMLEKQGVIGTQVPIKQRGLFWETIQDLINKEALSLEQEPAA